MCARALALALSLASLVAAPVLAAVEPSATPAGAPAGLEGLTLAELLPGADLALATGAPGAPSAFARSLAPPIAAQRRGITAPRSSAPHGPLLDAGRARILLRSLTIPGWGQATAGHRTSATVFGLAEVGVWASFASFRIQEQMRRESSMRTASLFAGIDLDGRDEEFRRIVGAFASSEEYNRLVVYRDAASIFLSDLDNPDYVGYREYIARNELKGTDAWNWASFEAFSRYADQRKDAQRAQRRAQTALAVAIANRLLSAVHAARVANRAPEPPRSWNLELGPVPGDDATEFRAAVRTRF
jgi:hypothetical protein